MTEERGMLREVLREDNFSGDVLFDEPMKNHTTLRIGGNAEAMVTPQDVVSLRNLLMEGREQNVPVSVVGGGSNLLVTDEGIEGIVVSTASLCRILVIEEKDDEVRLFVESGTPLQKMINLSKEKGYRGLEGLAGIPGSVGGAIRGNSGSFGSEIGNVIDAISVMNRYGKLSLLDARNLTVRYRSIDIPDDCVILSANMRLKKGDAHVVAKTINDFLLEKRTKQPIGAWSAGCVFRNPEGGYAGRLIDEAGCKGMRRGDVEVSGLHANFFVNRGEGRASDFLALMDEVRERVMKAFGIELEREIKIVGRDRGHAA